MSPAERQQLRRDRRKAGLVRVEVWVPARAEAKVREVIAEAVQNASVNIDVTPVTE